MIVGLAAAGLVLAHFYGEPPGPRMGKVGETPKRSGGGELGRRGEQLACEPSPEESGSRRGAVGQLVDGVDPAVDATSVVGGPGEE